MPKKKEIMAGYIRESDPALANSTTIESQAEAVRLHAEKEGYLYDTTRHKYKEEISVYSVPYMERKRLLDMLMDPLTQQRTPRRSSLLFGQRPHG